MQTQSKASGFLNGSHLRFEVTAEGSQAFDKWSVGNLGLFSLRGLLGPWETLASWISIFRIFRE